MLLNVYYTTLAIFYNTCYLEWTPIDTMPTSYIKSYGKSGIV